MASDEKMPMLVEGHDMLTTEVARLKIERPQIIDAIEEARAHGDLSENAEYHAAKERQGQIEAMIADIEDKLSRAMIIDPKTLSGDKVVFGATVHLVDEDEKPITYQIVGQTEADAKVGRISYSSPLGRAPFSPRFAAHAIDVLAGDRHRDVPLASGRRVDLHVQLQLGLLYRLVLLGRGVVVSAIFGVGRGHGSDGRNRPQTRKGIPQKYAAGNNQPDAPDVTPAPRAAKSLRPA